VGTIRFCAVSLNSVPGRKRPSSEESEIEPLERGLEVTRRVGESSVGTRDAGDVPLSGAEHEPQNRLVSGFSVWQRPHFAI